MRRMNITISTILAPLALAGCMEPVPMSNPAMGYSAEETSKMTGMPVGTLRNDGQCARSNAIMSNPGSTQNERYGAKTAGRANGCPGF